MTGRPAAFNLDKKRAERERAAKGAQRERGHEEFPFTVGKERFAIKGGLDWPIAAAEYVERQEWTSLFRGILAGDGPERFFNLDPPMSVSDVTDLMNAFSEWAGMENLPNSDAPPPPATTQT